MVCKAVKMIIPFDPVILLLRTNWKKTEVCNDEFIRLFALIIFLTLVTLQLGELPN